MAETQPCPWDPGPDGRSIPPLSQNSIQNVQTSEFRVDQTTVTGSYTMDDQPGETWGESGAISDSFPQTLEDKAAWGLAGESIPVGSRNRKTGQTRCWGRRQGDLAAEWRALKPQGGAPGDRLFPWSQYTDGKIEVRGGEDVPCPCSELVT